MFWKVFWLTKRSNIVHTSLAIYDLSVSSRYIPKVIIVWTIFYITDTVLRNKNSITMRECINNSCPNTTAGDTAGDNNCIDSLFMEEGS